jgi:hypothetical protein
VSLLCLLLEVIKRELEDNPELACAYPGTVGLANPWGQDRIRLANGVVIEALGTGGKIRGRRNRAQRPTLLVVDDPENDKHITSKRPMVSDSEDQQNLPAMLNRLSKPTKPASCSSAP